MQRLENLPNVEEILQEIDHLISLANSEATPTHEKAAAHLNKHDVESLSILREGIIKLANLERINLDEELNIPAINKYYRAQNTYLKIAASKCSAAVVDFLIQSGANPSQDLVFYPLQYQNYDLDNVLRTLKNYGVNINPNCYPLNDNYLLYRQSEKGHSLLFWAKRKDHNEVANALTNNQIKMNVWDSMSLPGAKLKDEAEKILENVVTPFPR